MHLGEAVAVFDYKKSADRCDMQIPGAKDCGRAKILAESEELTCGGCVRLRSAEVVVGSHVLKEVLSFPAPCTS
jgi:hypothetical protein